MSILTVRRADDERGAFIVLWALLITALLIMVAIVIDLGNARSVRRSDQSVADFSALAAGDNLALAPATACADAFGYVKGNLADLPTSGVTSPCNVLAPSGGAFPTSCGNSTTPQDFVAAGTAPYTITFRYPVSANDIIDSRFSGGAGAADGSNQCQRFKVTIAKAQHSLFAGIVNQFARTTQASAVMRAVPGHGTRTPSLWLLDPENCPALTSAGGSTINVGQAASPGPAIAGLITIDSDGQGSGCNATTLSVSGSGNQIYALPTTAVVDGSGNTLQGAIDLYALPTGASTCQSPACNPGDVNAQRVLPQPVPSPQRATRAPIDWTFNCKSDADGNNNATSIYPVYHSSATLPGGVFIDDCANSPMLPPYIDNLRSAIGTSGSPSGFSLYTGSCNPSGTVALPAGSYFINCNTFSIGNGTNFSITGDAVFAGDIKMTGGSLTVNSASNPGALPSGGSPECRGAYDSTGAMTLVPAVTGCTSFSSPGAAYVYMRGGDLTMTGGVLTLYHTMLYQNSGAVKVTGGSPPQWTAPTEGPFNKLSLWSEVGTDYTINGGGSLTMEGIYFAPEANPFKLTGGGDFPSLDAQFIARTLQVGGGSTLNLVPNPARNAQITGSKGELIR